MELFLSLLYITILIKLDLDYVLKMCAIKSIRKQDMICMHMYISLNWELIAVEPVTAHLHCSRV